MSFKNWFSENVIGVAKELSPVNKLIETQQNDLSLTDCFDTESIEKVDSTQGEWILKTETGQHICNFLLEVLAKYDVIIENTSIPHFDIRLLFGGNLYSDIFAISETELSGTIKWLEKDPRCRFHPDISLTKANRHLMDTVRKQAVSPDLLRKEDVHVGTQLGINHVGDIVAFCAGSQFILAPGTEDKLTLQLGEFSQTLDIDTELYTERSAFDGMIRSISLSPSAGQMVYAHTVSAIIRSVYVEAGIVPQSVLQVVSTTSNLKTTFVSEISQLYDRGSKIKPHSRLNSTPAFIEDLLHKYRDCIVLIDDAHPADDAPAIVRKNEETLEEITRRIGDSMGRGRKKGDSTVVLEPNCNVIIPAEYAYGKGSTAARSLVVEITEQIDGVKLHECQREPLLVSTHYYYFICWYVENYQEIKETLQEWLTEFRGASLSGILRRLNETYFCLYSAFALFLQYSFEKGFISKEEAEDTLHAFQELLTELIYAQNKRAEQDSNTTAKNLNYLQCISSMANNGQLIIANGTNEYSYGEYDGLMHNECLCLKPDKLMNKINTICPSATRKDIVNELTKKDALMKDGRNSAKQTAALGNKRFFYIPLNKL